MHVLIPCTVECHYNAVQWNIIWYTALQQLGQTLIILWTHKRNAIPRPYRWVTGCLLWEFWRILTVLERHHSIVHPKNYALCAWLCVFVGPSFLVAVQRCIYALQGRWVLNILPSNLLFVSFTLISKETSNHHFTGICLGKLPHCQNLCK